MPHIIKLEPEHIAYCEYFILGMMKNRADASKAVSWRGGTEDSPEVQLSGKCCEWAVAQFFKLDPRKVLNWTFRGDETDLVAVGRNIDVKGTRNPRAVLLIYSLEITKFYQEKQFDTLLFVRACPAPRFELVGWTTKEKFWREHFEAPSGPYGAKLDPGTWYMHMRELYEIDELNRENWEQMWKRPFDRPDLVWKSDRELARESIRLKKQFEFISGQWP